MSILMVLLLAGIFAMLFFLVFPGLKRLIGWVVLGGIAVWMIQSFLDDLARTDTGTAFWFVVGIVVVVVVGTVLYDWQTRREATRGSKEP